MRAAPKQLRIGLAVLDGEPGRRGDTGTAAAALEDDFNGVFAVLLINAGRFGRVALTACCTAACCGISAAVLRDHIAFIGCFVGIRGCICIGRNTAVLFECLLDEIIVRQLDLERFCRQTPRDEDQIAVIPFLAALAVSGAGDFGIKCRHIHLIGESVVLIVDVHFDLAGVIFFGFDFCARICIRIAGAVHRDFGRHLVAFDR